MNNKHIIITFLYLLSVFGHAQAINLPQTGQTSCYDTAGGTVTCAGTGQDGDKLAGAAWPSPRFTDNGDGTLTDRLTGLTWLKSGNCFGNSAWADALASANSLANGSCGLTDGSAAGDWRLPNFVELESLLNAEAADTAVWLNAQGFTNVSFPYWSSTSVAGNTATLAHGFFSTGIFGGQKTSTSNGRAWAVRGTSTGTATLWKTGVTTSYATGDDGDLQAGAAWPSPRFTDNGDGTATDGVTGLVWLIDANCFGQTVWADALTNVNGLASGACGLTDGSAAGDWRLPNRKELLSLADFSQANPALPAGHPFTGLVNGRHNTATTAAHAAISLWVFDTSSGREYPSGKTFVSAIMAVRTGAPPPPAPDITVSDSIAPATDLSIAFGDVTELTGSSDETVTVSNDGNADLTLGSLATANALAAPFSLQTDNCSSQVLAPAGNCTVTVRFAPQSIGTFSDSFDIPSDDPDENPVTFSVDGTGVGQPVPDITVTDSIAPAGDLAIDFGTASQAVFVTATVTITNDGNADLAVGTIAALNALAAPFSTLNDNCSGTTVTPGASCTLNVRFEPTADGTFNDSFDIPSDDADEATVTVNLTGARATVPDITVTDTVTPADDLQVAFGNITTGNTSDQTVTLRNDGTADLVIGQIAQANTLAAPFTILNDTCSAQTVIPTASCTFTLRFSPAAVTDSSDSFDIPSNDADENPATINVSGSGVTASTTSSSSNSSDGILGIGAFNPLTLLALLMLSAVNLACRQRNLLKNR